MDFDGSDITNNQEILSEEEKKSKLADLLSRSLSSDEVKENIQLLSWGARQCLRTTSEDIGGIANLSLQSQDLLAQDVPNVNINKALVYDGISNIRDVSQVDILKGMGFIKPKDFPDGLYTDVNVFQGNRTKFFSEEQKMIWEKKKIHTPDEGLAIHPQFNENLSLESIKIFWHGHRNNLIVRTVSIAEMNARIKDGSQVDLRDNWPVRKL